MAKKRRRTSSLPPDAVPSSPGKPSRRGVFVTAAGAAVAMIVILTVVLTGPRSPRLLPAGTSDSPDVILITIDTWRADAAGFAGNRRASTPFLDQLARKGRVYTSAHAHNVVTLPSHTNILTGLYPYQHGVRDNAGFTLDAKHKTLAAMLRERDYATGAFVGAFPLDRRFGLNAGFDVYDDRYPEGSGKLDFKIQERRAEEVLAPAVKWWSAQSGKKFMWIHLYDPHAPYQPPPDIAAQYASQPYLGEVAYVDQQLRRSLGPIIEGNENLFVVVTGDHGESLGEHGELTHGLFAYEATLRVPLVLYDLRRIEPRVVREPVRHVDIAPTILELAGAAVSPLLAGTSLLSAEPRPRPAYFESLSASLNRGWAPLVGMIDGDDKYIDLPLPELYNLRTDPGENRNVVRDQRRAVARLRRILAESAPAPEGAGRSNVSAEESARLLSLGYIAGNVAKKDYTEDDDPKKLIDLDTKLHRTIELYQLGQNKRAIALIREVATRRPDMVIAQEMLAFMLQQEEQTGAAVDTLKQALARGNAPDSVRIRLGLVLSESGRAKEAVEVLAPFSSTKDPEVLNAYGIALADVGRFADAIAQFRHVLSLDETNATAYQNLGIVSLRAGDVRAARNHLQQALNLDPNLPLALNTLGVVHARNGDDAAAIDMWSRAVALDRRQYDALFNLAIVAERAGRAEVARSALVRFIETAPPARYSRDIAQARRKLDAMNERM